MNDLADSEQIRARVCAVILVPAYRQAKVRALDGRQYSITRRTVGIVLDELVVGQEVLLTVTRGPLPRVLSASIVD